MGSGSDTILCPSASRLGSGAGVLGLLRVEEVTDGAPGTGQRKFARCLVLCGGSKLFPL